MNAATADIVIQFLKAAGAACDKAGEIEDVGNLRASLEHKLPYSVNFHAGHGYDDRRMASMHFHRFGEITVSFQFIDRPPADAIRVAALHLRVARLASLLEVIVETGDRMNGDEDFALWATVGLRSLESLLQMTDVASELRQMIASNPIPTAT